MRNCKINQQLQLRSMCRYQHIIRCIELTQEWYFQYLWTIGGYQVQSLYSTST